MVTMTAYRQRKPPQQIDHIELIKLAVDNEAASMVLFSRHNNKPTLVGLTGGQAIVKPQEAGDDGNTFDSLYDIAVSIREYRAMTSHNVSSVEELPRSVYEIQLRMDLVRSPRIRIRLKASSDLDVRDKLTKLVNDNPEFRERLIRAFVMELFDSQGMDLVHTGAFQRGESTADTPEWEVVCKD